MKHYSAIFILLVLMSCNKHETNHQNDFETLKDSLKTIYAPDKRVEVFDINLNKKDKTLTVSGETTNPEVVSVFNDKITPLIDKSGTFIVDYNIDLLPNKTVGETKYAVVNNSVANIRSKPKHSAELATQAILGTVLKVLKIDGDFYLIQTPDRYISWVDHGGVTLMTDAELNTWQAAPKIIYTQTFGHAYASENANAPIVSDLVLGAQLALLETGKNFYKIAYPDKRVGFINKKEAVRYSHWIKTVEPSGDLIEDTAKHFVGSPYLWGGTSTKGMDCSGFTKTVYLMNGFVIPRDASQQINAGEIVDSNLTFENLQKGDLLFFGKKATDSTKQRTTHVGIWLGNEKNEFIHAASQVRINSINEEADNYDAFNKNRYLGARRYLGVEDDLIIDLKKHTTLKL
ncbi:C40 family peptidase [Hwangdonia lutea]|uniref:SH3 domain-containing C40 family peptidase n=1 Tax=Hwangdonia lutea TaxID=3075823 RepID=A0AA97ENU6_9FLAO|nr:SH3 domain-containing C40 family peptidase [Hwangdonia sp. SCSIO 19198]WOD44376.1 SH3 domain-containing C40 family peptidase [Hwangdonia sp. SCSIO 19198]